MPDKSDISVALQDSIKLLLDNAYVKLTQNLQGENIPEIYLPPHSTRAIVAEVIAINLEGGRPNVSLVPPSPWKIEAKLDRRDDGYTIVKHYISIRRS